MKQKADRAEDELKANLNALNISIEIEGQTDTAMTDDTEEATFKFEDLPTSMDLPQSRFNACLTVSIDDKLYIYGGTFEKTGRGETNLDDFHVIDLGKLDGVRQFWNNTIIHDTDSESSSDDEEIEDDGENEQMQDIDRIHESTTVESKMEIDLPKGFEDEGIDEFKSSFNPSYPQPIPFESLKSFYDRTNKEWIVLVSDQSKAGRREAFVKAESYWWECREEIREIEERMEESGVREMASVSQSDRKDKRR
jgi:Domain of unknown function (DUF4110)